MVKRIAIDKSCGSIVDYQDFFLSQVERRARARLRANTRNFVRLLGYFRIPMIATPERPVYAKGAVPEDIKRSSMGGAQRYPSVASRLAPAAAGRARPRR